ncbi:spore coat protein [Evansella clarkii]|uniref:spore coat protein n=2 Tax=Evansella clarkii TaxID=79879 RepID=UPI0039C1D257
MAQDYLAVHEKAELHEMLMFKTNCLQKSQAMQSLVQDQELKTLLQQDVKASQTNIKALQQLLSQ